MNNIEIPGVRYKWFPYSQVDNEKVCDERGLIECPYEYDSLEEVEDLYFIQIDGIPITKNGFPVLTRKAVNEGLCKVYGFDLIEVSADGYFIGCEFRMPKHGIKNIREGVSFVPGGTKFRFLHGKDCQWDYEADDEPVEE
jgi:hypothetical protein